MRWGIALVATVLALAGCGSPAAEQAGGKKPKVVEVIAAEQPTGPIPLSASGIAEAKRDALLSFGASGRIAAVAVSKGQAVQAGQLLAALDEGAFQSALAAAEGQVQEAIARRQKTLEGSEAEAVQQQRLQLEAARQRLMRAKTELAQAERLFAGGAISASERDAASDKARQAEIDYENQQVALERLLKKADPADVAMAQAGVTQAASQKAQAQKMLADARLVAPFSGTVVEVERQAGEIAGAGQPVIHLVDLSEVRVTLDVPRDQVAYYRTGARVSVRAESGITSEGTITFVSPVTDDKTGKYRVEVTVPNPHQDWRGGMLAAVDVPRQIKGVLVPLESVGISQSDRYVMVVENGVAKRRSVRVGQVVGDRIEVISGLRAGETVVRTGITYLVDGERVVPKGES